MTSLQSFIDRLESGSGGDRELDNDIFVALELDRWTHPQSGVIIRFRNNPSITYSLNAAIALVKRIRNIYSLTMIDDPSGQGAKLTIWPKGLSGDEELLFEGVHTSMPRALLVALLKSLQAERKET